MNHAALEGQRSPTPARTLRSVPRAIVQRKCACGGTAGPDGQCESCKRKPQMVQRAASSPAAPVSAPESVNRTISSPGRPLDSSTRDFMEPRFGHDFSKVRIHTDSQAGESARDINAHAYTVGNNIAFAPGQYQPDSYSGRQLLAHELAHTVQQGGLQRRASDLAVDTAPNSRFEHEADTAARAVMHGSGQPIIATRPPSPTISRKEGDVTTKPINGKKPKSLATAAGFTHKVTPTGEATVETDQATPKTLEEFLVEPFYLSADKGPAALAIHEGMASGGSLESTLEMTGARTRTALWQERPDTGDLRNIWLQKVGWTGQPAATVNDLWERSGGDKEFPKVGGATAEMDHIVELQIGGNNPPENIQPLDRERNGRSGREIRKQLQSLAQAIANDKTLSNSPNQVKMRFTKIVRRGAQIALPKTCPPTSGQRHPLAVEACALKLKVAKGADGAISVAREDYPISAGGRPPTNLRVPATFATRADEKVALKGDSENDAASTLVPGLLLNTLYHGPRRNPKIDLIEAQIDDRDKTRLPITLDSNAKPFSLNVGPGSVISLPPALKKTAIGFTFKYLSPGKITSVEMNADGGVDWSGQITPTAKFLPTLEVEYKEGRLRLKAKIPEDKLKKAKLFGATITAASLDVVLSPFDIVGNIDFVLGNVNNPAAIGKLTIGKDDQGLVGQAKLQLKIPKVDSSEITFQYKGGADRDEWSGELKIDSSQIKLPYVSGGSLVARVRSRNGVVDITFDGKINLELPKKRGTAEVALRRWGNNCFFSGRVDLNIPKVKDFSAAIVYNITHERLEVSVPAEDGKMPSRPITFVITEDFKGTLKRFKLVVTKSGNVIVSGAGGFSFKKGKAAGDVNVELAEDGSFNGDGSVSYALTENITVKGEVVFKEKGTPKLAIRGTLTFKSLQLMKEIADTKSLFDKDFSIPIPYASIGGVGLKAIFGVKLEAGYSIGPIVVEPLIFTAGFNPLEDEPQLDLGVSGELKVPASVSLTASLSGGVKIDIYIAEVGGKITLSGTLKLKGGLFVPFKGSYSKKDFAVEMTPEARLKLFLGIALSATVWAKAGVGWLSKSVSKTWKLGEREVDTGLGFGIKAPISYSSRTGARIPSFSDITLVPPDFSRENLSRVADRLFGEAKGEPADA